MSAQFIKRYTLAQILQKKQKFSISLSKKILEELRVTSAREGISVNNLINHALERYSDWNLHNNEFIPIRKALLAKFLDKFTHEEIESVAQNMVVTRSKDTVIRFTSRYDAINTLKTFDGWLRLTGFPYTYDIEDSIHRFVILHDLGSKWSLYLARILTGTLNQFGLVPKYEYTDKILSIAVDLSEFKTVKKRTDKQIEILRAAIKDQEKK